MSICYSVFTRQTILSAEPFLLELFRVWFDLIVEKLHQLRFRICRGIVDIVVSENT